MIRLLFISTHNINKESRHSFHNKPWNILTVYHDFLPLSTNSRFFEGHFHNMKSLLHRKSFGVSWFTMNFNYSGIQGFI